MQTAARQVCWTWCSFSQANKDFFAQMSSYTIQATRYSYRNLVSHHISCASVFHYTLLSGLCDIERLYNTNAVDSLSRKESEATRFKRESVVFTKGATVVRRGIVVTRSQTQLQPCPQQRRTFEDVMRSDHNFSVSGIPHENLIIQCLRLLLWHNVGTFVLKMMCCRLHQMGSVSFMILWQQVINQIGAGGYLLWASSLIVTESRRRRGWRDSGRLC